MEKESKYTFKITATSCYDSDDLLATYPVLKDFGAKKFIKHNDKYGDWDYVLITLSLEEIIKLMDTIRRAIIVGGTSDPDLCKANLEIYDDYRE